MQAAMTKAAVFMAAPGGAAVQCGERADRRVAFGRRRTVPAAFQGETAFHCGTRVERRRQPAVTAARTAAPTLPASEVSTVMSPAALMVTLKCCSGCAAGPLATLP